MIEMEERYTENLSPVRNSWKDFPFSIAIISGSDVISTFVSVTNRVTNPQLNN